MNISDLDISKIPYVILYNRYHSKKEFINLVLKVEDAPDLRRYKVLQCTNDIIIMIDVKKSVYTVLVFRYDDFLVEYEFSLSPKVYYRWSNSCFYKLFDLDEQNAIKC